MREKLIELFCNAQQVIHVPYGIGTKESERYIFQQMADHLIANGVTIPVRCKGCKHFCPYDGEEHKGDCAELVGLESCVYEDDFCSYGERREGE